MNHINYSQKDIAVLQFLAFCEKQHTPCTWKTIRYIFRSYDDRQLRNSLQVLEKYGRILKYGQRGHYLYTPSVEGLKYLLKQQAKELEAYFRENVRDTIRKFTDKDDLTNPEVW